MDDSTERWLDQIEEKIEYKACFCGHWHTDKREDKMHFLFRTFESDEQFHKIQTEEARKLEKMVHDDLCDV